MAKSLLVPALTYLQLVKLIKTEIAEGQKIIQQTQAEKYWKIGQVISEYVLSGKDRAKYGEHIFEKISGDLNVHIKTLRQSVDFFRKFPIGNARSQLPWTHFRELLSLPDPIHRQALMNKARREGLTSREFKELVKKKKIVISTDGPIPQLKVVRGKLYHYRIDEWTPLGKEPRKCIDCGFDVSYNPPVGQLAKFSANQIIKTLKNDKAYRLQESAKSVLLDIYTFQAKVLRVIDGDTLLTDVDLGLMVYKEHKLRLRRIDTPEIDTPEGKKADAFVKERIGQCAFVVIKTYKDDKYGRYLVGVFYSLCEQDPAKVAAQGTFLNQELLDNRLAVKW
jgi:endonuclease YncB( thermonuclease family)